MVSKQAVRLSELDSAYFDKNRRAPVSPQELGGAAQPPRRPAPARERPRSAGDGAAVARGQKISLSQMNANLDLIEVAMGWELGPQGQAYELDVEAFLLNQAGKVPGDGWFVFYNQPVSPDGAVRLLDTPAAGAGTGDDALIQLRLGRLDRNVARIAFILTIHEARERGYHFGNVQNAYLRIVDKQGGRELLRFHLTEYYNTVCSMVVGEIYRYKNEWRFNPVGNGTGDDLLGLCARYGVDAAG